MLARSCGKCGKAEPPFRCARCTGVRYCTRDCQRADWPVHKPQCTPPRTAEEEAENQRIVGACYALLRALPMFRYLLLAWCELRRSDPKSIAAQFLPTVCAFGARPQFCLRGVPNELFRPETIDRFDKRLAGGRQFAAFIGELRPWSVAGGNAALVHIEVPESLQTDDVTTAEIARATVQRYLRLQSEHPDPGSAVHYLAETVDGSVNVVGPDILPRENIERLAASEAAQNRMKDVALQHMIGMGEPLSKKLATGSAADAAAVTDE
jgi:hypothetical protein